MRNIGIGLAAVLSAVMFWSPAPAQTPKDVAKPEPKTAPAPLQIRYFASLGDLLGDLPVEAFIKETRQDDRLVSAVLDVCYSVSSASDRKDRFVIDLKADGEKLSGIGQSLESKTPVTVNLTRKTMNKTIAFNGKITLGTNVSLVSSPDNTDIDEKEFLQTQVVDDDLVEAPKDFTQVSPHSVGIRVKREGFGNLVNRLRSENVQIALDSIVTDCAALRSGQQVLRMIVDPARAPSLIAKEKAAQGVVAGGWTSSSYDMERAVRFPASGWVVSGKLDRDKLAATLSAAAAKAFAATPISSKWNETTGEITFSIKRPSQLAPALNLTETLEITALAGPEKPGDADKLIVWLGIPSSKTTDESPAPHLQFAENSGGDDESTFNDDDGVVKALAVELKGQRWDTDKASWK
jgi:hypothetical protein